LDVPKTSFLKASRSKQQSTSARPRIKSRQRLKSLLRLSQRLKSLVRSHPYDSGSSICRNSKLTSEIIDLQTFSMILGGGGEGRLKMGAVGFS